MLGRSVVCHGFVLDSGGTKMSKSIGNVISPDDIIGKEVCFALCLYLSFVCLSRV